jgi:hypothetical protein
MELFKCRASASGNLATKPKDKNDLLSKTTETFLKEWATEKKYGYRKNIKNKYLTRGIEDEDQAIEKTIEWLDLGFQVKNETFYENEYFCGTPDLIIDGVVYDTKCSWDCFTFPRFETEIPTKDYFYQLQVYMSLLGLKKAVLVYVLLNTPPSYDNEAMTYDHLPISDRIKTFEIDYDQEVIDKLQQRVIDSRLYIKKLLENA